MAQQLSPDAKLLDQLAKSGSDLKQLHRFEFVLHFDTQFSAERAELDLIGLAFETEIRPGKNTSERVIHAFKVMYPAERDLAGLRDKLNSIADQGHGTYEGWTAKVFVRKPAG